MRKPKKTPKSINPNKVKTRDPNQLSIIQGATKAGVHKDLKKEANKMAAREPVRNEICQDCKEAKPDVSEALCPWAMDVHNDSIHIRVCDECYHERAMSV